ncbi:MAG: enoyl-CoA hydratase, partial [Aeromonas salmonicida]
LELFADANQREGVAAFLEKRPPRWQYEKSNGVTNE